MLIGRNPTAIWVHFCVANLTALKKQDGGIGPKAIAGTLRKILAKLVCRKLLLPAGGLLLPLQIGVAVPSVQEALIHSVTQSLTVNSDHFDFVLSEFDPENVSNMVPRDAIVGFFHQHFPEFFNRIYCCNGGGLTVNRGISKVTRS